MATQAVATSADDLLKLPTGKGKRYELIAGELQVMRLETSSTAAWR
jgi:hypothetical protein